VFFQIKKKHEKLGVRAAPDKNQECLREEIEIREVSKQCEYGEKRGWGTMPSDGGQ